MATAKEKVETTAEAAAKASPAAEPVYTTDEFASVAKKMFKTTPDIVTAALTLSGKKTATKSEALKIVADFANKEVSK